MRHVAQPCELPHGAFERTILVTHTSCATPATTRAKAKGGSYVTPSPPTKRSEEPRGAPYHHRYAARHRSTQERRSGALLRRSATARAAKRRPLMHLQEHCAARQTGLVHCGRAQGVAPARSRGASARLAGCSGASARKSHFCPKDQYTRIVLFDYSNTLTSAPKKAGGEMIANQAG